MISLFKKFFGTNQSRKVGRYQKTVAQINAIEKQYQLLSEQQFLAHVEELKTRAHKEESLDSLLPEAYAVTKNACRRLVGRDIHVSGYDQKWDMVPYDVQLLGAIALSHGNVAEMQTGEGKTLTAVMPLVLHALTGKPVHLVTVNDYLAKRDPEWVGEVFRYLGFSVGALTSDVSPEERKKVYACDIVYGTASEFGFDYLRDNSMALAKDQQVQRGHFFGLIDEVDSILIDEARTPLIISGPARVSNQMYDELRPLVDVLVKKQRNLCNQKASKAKEILSKLVDKESFSKEEKEQSNKAFIELWLVGKGTPNNKILRRIKENPDHRALIEKWETHFYAEPNKEERHRLLAELYILVDERSSDFELTDLGMLEWNTITDSKDDFVMLDLGHEYGEIDRDNALSDDEKMAKKESIRSEDVSKKEKMHNLRQMMRAHLLMERDIDYIVQDKKIVIIDENTGRPQEGRRFSEGLHQAIEAKENVPIQQETQTYASITLQNYFRMYEKLSGMTGTALTEAGEFKEIYSLDVLAIPTHRKCKRDDGDDKIYMTEREKYAAIISDVEEKHKLGRPVLLGTESVEVSEVLSRIFKQKKLPHVVLNAKNHEKEAEIIAAAGKRGSIVVATNMAGRGTDIKLQEGVVDLGGLHVVGTTRHQSRRIDRQLRGRCARQGDVGSSQFYVSFEDSLMRLFTSPKLSLVLQKFRPEEGEPISAKMLNKSIETAQKRVEGRNYSMRKHTLEYDDVMNKHRSEVYKFRNDLISETDIFSTIEEIIEDACSFVTGDYLSQNNNQWQAVSFCEQMMKYFPITFDSDSFGEEFVSMEEIETIAAKKVVEMFQHKIEHESAAIMMLQKNSSQSVDPRTVLSDVLRSILLRDVDQLWQEHLHNIDHLRTEVSMRAHGQKDPLMEFKHEAFALFDTFSKELKTKIAGDVFRFGMVGPAPKQRAPKGPGPSGLYIK
ncbi:preprotein translocase subunit SecA [Candidatus Aerophobetes bacterium]|uniref:Protein translocase subunit SecA n=1 Tax=Aerophobetes bacterium TaxID=2030807 RepID=A0A2A4X415_UNCAE|nr:MAG: preprotein translocase subunit SecA [Candidatus Aerophobetes bacterium]